MIRKSFALFSFLVYSTSYGQILSPTIGTANLVSWFAFGLKQDLDTLNNRGWVSSTSLGAGTMSNPNNYNPFRKVGIIAVNQEFNNKFHKNWNYSLGLYYQRQYNYESVAPYQLSSEPIKQEFRIYGKSSYYYKINFFELTPTIRQEVEKYFTNNFSNHNDSWRLRTRIQVRFGFDLTSDKTHRILLFSEHLFSSIYKLDVKKWTPFQYTDSYFSIYYSYAPIQIPVVFSVGYSNNIIGIKTPTSTNYIGLDIVWKNPFKLAKSK